MERARETDGQQWKHTLTGRKRINRRHGADRHTYAPVHKAKHREVPHCWLFHHHLYLCCRGEPRPTELGRSPQSASRMGKTHWVPPTVPGTWAKPAPRSPLWQRQLCSEGWIAQRKWCIKHQIFAC
ncbi:hypothetical protein KIL84_008360 [Mauremys mutica]|uniref:Uncharacterized protein n=1 Tax=Mauremys mutica TaxID=74926 RepID=A0A9D4B0A8_9SAUR|nr:hypothetical protein KIL84_008360 [Mauremys mutica]